MAGATRTSSMATIASATRSHASRAIFGCWAVRIAGKLLRYTLELAVVAGCPLPRSVLATFKRLQDKLGLWHDFVVLTDTCMEISTTSTVAMHQPELFGHLLDLGRATWRKSLRELAQFQKLWLDHGERLSDQILAAIARVAPVAPAVIPSIPEATAGPGADESAPSPPPAVHGDGPESPGPHDE